MEVRLRSAAQGRPFPLLHLPSVGRGVLGGHVLEEHSHPRWRVVPDASHIGGTIVNVVTGSTPQEAPRLGDRLSVPQGDRWVPHDGLGYDDTLAVEGDGRATVQSVPKLKRIGHA